MNRWAYGQAETERTHTHVCMDDDGGDDDDDGNDDDDDGNDDIDDGGNGDDDGDEDNNDSNDDNGDDSDGDDDGNDQLMVAVTATTLVVTMTMVMATMEEKGARDAAYANAVFQWSNSGEDWSDGHYAQDGEFRGKPQYKKLDGSGGFYKHKGDPVGICAWSRAHCPQRSRPPHPSHTTPPAHRLSGARRFGHACELAVAPHAPHTPHCPWTPLAGRRAALHYTRPLG